MFEFRDVKTCFLDRIRSVDSLWRPVAIRRRASGTDSEVISAVVGLLMETKLKDEQHFQWNWTKDHNVSMFRQCSLFISFAYLWDVCKTKSPGWGKWQFGQPWVTAIAHESPWLCPADSSGIVPYCPYFLWSLKEMCRSRAGHFYQGLMPALEMPATLAPRIFNQVQLGSKRFCSFFWSFNTEDFEYLNIF